MVLVRQSIMIRGEVHIINIPELRSIARLCLCLRRSFAVDASEVADPDVLVFDVALLPRRIPGILWRAKISQRCRLCHRGRHLG